MAIKSRSGKYICSYCGKQFDRHQEADACRDSHDLLYIQISKDDLDRLLMFIRIREDSLITPTLWESLNKTRR